MVSNKVILIGRLTKDAVIVSPKTKEQKPIAHFTLAVDRVWKKGADDQENRDKADFFCCNAYGQRAEFLERYGKKGIKFALEGHLTSGSYEKDGVRIYTVEVDVENIQFCEKKGAGKEETGKFMEIPPELEAEMPFQ